VAAIADEIEVHVAIEYDRRPVAVEGLAERRWVLLDYGDVVVHVFVQEEREFYRLERLYRDADSVEWREVAAPAT
jgi:ribosome-associated protein